MIFVKKRLVIKYQSVLIRRIREKLIEIISIENDRNRRVNRSQLINDFAKLVLLLKFSS